MQPVAPTSFSIISQNIGATPFAKDGLKRVSRFSRALKQPALQTDFVCLQETFTVLSRLLIGQTSKHHPYVSIPTSRNFRLLPSGLAFLSKYPIIESRFLPFLTAKNQDRLANKGVLLTRVLHPNLGTINFLNVHLQASYQSAIQYTDVRDRQLDILREFVFRECLQNLTVMSGDFNSTEDQNVYQRIVAPDDLGFHDALRILHPEHTLFTWLPDNPYASDPCPPLRLDYIFVKDNTHWKWQSHASTGALFSGAHFYTSSRPKPYSDHEGLRMALSFEPRTSSRSNH